MGTPASVGVRAWVDVEGVPLRERPLQLAYGRDVDGALKGAMAARAVVSR